MKYLGLAVCVFAFSLQVGCAVFGPKRALLIEEGKTMQFVYQNKKSDDFFRNKYNQSTDKKLTRNEIIDDLRGLINQNYNDYEVALRTDTNLKDLGTTVATIGLTAAAATTGGEATKSLLAAIATGVIGVNAAVDKSIFKDFGMEAIRFEMRRLRAEREKLINEGMKKSVTEYTLNKAIDDLVEYYNVGFVTRALDNMVITAGTNAEVAQKAADKSR